MNTSRGLLILEDEQARSELLKQAGEKFGWKCVIAETLRQFVDILKERPKFDLFILDGRVPCDKDMGTTFYSSDVRQLIDSQYLGMPGVEKSTGGTMGAVGLRIAHYLGVDFPSTVILQSAEEDGNSNMSSVLVSMGYSGEVIIAKKPETDPIYAYLKKPN